MDFSKPLIEGILLKRYKRFFADVEIDLGGKKTTVLAHVPNTGSMKSCSEPGSPCLISKTDDPTRKLQYTLQMVRSGSTWVGVNTANPNKLGKEAFENKTFSHWKNYDSFAGEVKISDKSRVDLVLWKADKNQPTEERPQFPFAKKSCFHFVEVKNVTLAEKPGKDLIAHFPDSVSERALKHIEELLLLIKKGHTAELLFVVQREDCKSFQPADHIHADYGKALRKAQKQGLLITAALCSLTPEKIIITKKTLPLNFG